MQTDDDYKTLALIAATLAVPFLGDKRKEADVKEGMNQAIKNAQRLLALAKEAEIAK